MDKFFGRSYEGVNGWGKHSEGSCVEITGWETKNPQHCCKTDQVNCSTQANSKKGESLTWVLVPFRPQSQKICLQQSLFEGAFSGIEITSAESAFFLRHLPGQYTTCPRCMSMTWSISSLVQLIPPGKHNSVRQSICFAFYLAANKVTAVTGVAAAHQSITCISRLLNWTRLHDWETLKQRPSLCTVSEAASLSCATLFLWLSD